MDKIPQTMRGYLWTYVDKDAVALGIIRDRIESAAGNRKMFFYSDTGRWCDFPSPEP